jgi:hypothetical protein
MSALASYRQSIANFRFAHEMKAMKRARRMIDGIYSI